LWTGHEPHLAMTALMMFVARLPGSVRAQVYRAADGPDPPVVFGDLPATEGMAELLAWAQRERSPLACSLPESRTTGRLPDIDHVLRTAAGRLAELGPAKPGRSSQVWSRLVRLLFLLAG
jgi:hypothetical protein